MTYGPHIYKAPPTKDHPLVRPDLRYMYHELVTYYWIAPPKEKPLLIKATPTKGQGYFYQRSRSLPPKVKDTPTNGQGPSYQRPFLLSGQILDELS